MDQLGQAYITATDRAHRSGMNIHIYSATDIYSRGGYILVSDLHAPQLSMECYEFEYIDTVYPETSVKEIK